MASPKPVPSERAEPRKIEPAREQPIDWTTFDTTPSPEQAKREMAEMKSRWMDNDHAEALRDNYAFDVEREDPEGLERERRADRREARRLADMQERRS